MIALKNTTNNQIFYITNKNAIGTVKPAIVDVEYTDNGSYSIYPPDGYNTMSKVNVTVDVDTKLTTSAVTYTESGDYTIVPEEGYNGLSEVSVSVDVPDRYDEGVAAGEAAQKAKLSSATFTTNDTYTREDGWNTVQVNVDTVTPYNNGFAAGVADQKSKLTSVQLTDNGTYTREDGYNSVEVSVDTQTPYNNGYAAGKQDGINEQKAKLTSTTITQNDTYTREDGWNSVTVNVQPNLTTANIDTNGTYTPTGYDGYSSVTVNITQTTPLTLSTDEIVSPLTGGTFALGIRSDAPWTITNIPNWATINETSGIGFTTVYVVVSSNATARDGSFTVSDGTTTSTVYLTQIDLNGYLTIKAFADGTLTFKTSATARTIEYSLDDGTTWTSMSNGTVATLQTGDRVLLKGNNATYADYVNYSWRSNYFGSDDTDFRFNLYGNIMSLVNGDNFVGTTLPSTSTGAFAGMFSTSKLQSAKYLVLPSTTAEYCYYNMFFNGLNLIEAPELPATTLSAHCYQGMFQNSKIVKAPSLPATTLANYCYMAMFSSCKQLKMAPVLPATTLADYCYKDMFSSATGLEVPPALPATTIAKNCYEGMFRNCSSLKTAPALPATTLEDSCYLQMFNNCTSLTTAPDLMATTLVHYCYNSMFSGCSNLNSVKVMSNEAGTSSGQATTKDWLKNVSASGTFTKKSGVNWTTGQTYGVPTGWTVVNA